MIIKTFKKRGIYHEKNLQNRSRLCKLCKPYGRRGKKTAGVANATVNFMTQKMIVEFEEGKEPKTVMNDVLKACKKVEPDCEIEL